MHIFFAFYFSSLVVKKGLGVRVMASNITFNNISVILWRFFHWWRKLEYPGEIYRLAASH